MATSYFFFNLDKHNINAVSFCLLCCVSAMRISAVFCISIHCFSITSVGVGFRLVTLLKIGDQGNGSFQTGPHRVRIILENKLYCQTHLRFDNIFFFFYVGETGSKPKEMKFFRTMNEGVGNLIYPRKESMSFNNSMSISYT